VPMILHETRLTSTESCGSASQGSFDKAQAPLEPLTLSTEVPRWTRNTFAFDRLASFLGLMLIE
jgi:hypothetical protein